ncbi:CHAD domain-containing protein [Enterobacter asburiae]|uniref:CHAD domain-containing protein n=1 Tax=Enterobacter asburiae TaxID=61645 RepID=UPI00387DCC3B
MAENFKRFADIHLSRHAAELKSTFAYPLGDQYGDQLPRLSRNIDSMLLLSGAYDGVKTQAWLENWQGLKHAIETASILRLSISVTRPFRRSRSGCTAETLTLARTL